MTRKNILGSALIILSLGVMGYFVHWVLIPCLVALFWGKHLEEQ